MQFPSVTLPEATATAQPSRPAHPPMTVASVMGEIVWLLTQSSPHKHLFLADLEWLVMPPVLLSQYRIFRVQDRPVGVAFWAFLTEEAEARLKGGNPRLRADEWKAGDRAWLIDLVAPFGQAEVMLKDLKESVFKEKTLTVWGQNEA